MASQPADGDRPTGLTERTIRVLEGVVDAGEPVGPRGLARVVGFDRSAVGRILRALEDMGMLERRPEGYVPGSRLFALARVLSARDTFSEYVAAILGRLVEQFDETCYVCTLHGDVAVFTHEIQSSKPLRFVVELGRPVPLHAGAAGRAILSGLDPDVAAALLGTDPLPALTPRTLRRPERLLAVAEEDRLRGYSVSIEERVPGGASVAAPFFDRSGRCQGSVVFTTPLSRLDAGAVDDIGRAVAAAAQALSGRLGARPRRGNGGD
jgi:DNA-binding IclR family transcriptional regulator